MRDVSKKLKWIKQKVSLWNETDNSPKTIAIVVSCHNVGALFKRIVLNAKKQFGI